MTVAERGQDRKMEISQLEQQKEKDQNNLKDPEQHQMYQYWHYGVPEGEDREKGVENLFDKIMTKKFPNLKKKANIPIQEDRGSQAK